MLHPSQDRPKRRLQPTRAIPIVEQLPLTLGAAEHARIAALGEKLCAAERVLCARTPFGPEVAPGTLPGPALVIEDHSAIALFEQSGDVAYSYRGLLLTGRGDLVVVGGPRNVAFEGYCRNVLGLGQITVLSPASADATIPLAARAAADDALVATAVAEARQAGGLTLVPYMGTGHVWKLAGRIAAQAGRQVRVAAPLPQLTRRVNDKSWFAARVAELLGPRAAPPSATVYGFAALAGRVASFARRYPSIAVKLTESASSAGNLVLDAGEMARLSLRRIADGLRERLDAIGWRGGFPLIVTAWEQPILASPSVQLWIPEPVDGAPIVEGIFDQTVLGAAAEFSGALPSTLPSPWQERLAREAMQLASLFQQLGYFGRCSFDSIVIGDDAMPAELHWVECNGRWGGVSIPMTLANRLTGDWTRRPPVIVERSGLQGRPRPLPNILSDLEDELFKPSDNTSGLVILSPGWLDQGTGFEVMHLDRPAADKAARAHRIETRMRQVLGLATSA